ncbi:hypothetical protein MTR_2g058545 [Medicago truncatula]|uniref:Uncharacterized protein n=1 Tax=Medicago truncatula TaxID=3880 RepID=A0A072VIP3_MEDTR|nr:hypothetical protein MTR_2g058545 [Medicago truncatula]
MEPEEEENRRMNLNRGDRNGAHRKKKRRSRRPEEEEEFEIASMRVPQIRTREGKEKPKREKEKPGIFRSLSFSAAISG